MNSSIINNFIDSFIAFLFAISGPVAIMLSITSANNIDPKNVLYMGDDIPDFECLKSVGISTCPRDSAVEIRETCDYISHIDGGKGAVRDVIEQVLRVQGKWMDEDAHKW